MKQRGQVLMVNFKRKALTKGFTRMRLLASSTTSARQNKKKDPLDPLFLEMFSVKYCNIVFSK